MKHANVKLGEYEIPLIGIPEEATLQICDRCKHQFKLSEVKFIQNGQIFCK